MSNNNARLGEVSPVDYSRLLHERCRGNKELAAKLLRNLLEESGPRWIEDVESLVVAGDMEKLVKVGHSIKGSCKMIYAVSMVEVATALENAAKAGSLSDAEIVLEDLKGVFSETREWLKTNPELLE